MNISTDGSGSPSCSLVYRSRGGLARSLTHRFATLAALAALVAGVPSARAQSNTEGGAFGRVVGASAAQLAGAQATIESIGTKVKRSAAITPAGTFDFGNLPVGDYVVTLTLANREPMRQPAYIGLGTTTTVRFETEDRTLQLEKLVVAGSGVPIVNVVDPEINLNLRVETIGQLPVSRDPASVALMVPGVSRGDDNYFDEDSGSGTTSFAGASIAENAYYLNGFNITEFRRGQGYANVPFEFLQEFHIKQFGYSAEFGRSTGGVVDMVSKRGTDEFKASASVFWEPAALRAHQPDSYARDGVPFRVNSIGDRESRRYNLQASGPLVKSHLYFYGLVEGRQDRQDFVSGINQRHFRTSSNPFWAARLDWQLNERHAVEYTAFTDRRTRRTGRNAYDLKLGNFSFTPPAAIGDSLGDSFTEFGGVNQVVRYTGRFFENLNFSVLAGTGKRNSSIYSDVADDPLVIDNRSGSTLSGAGWESRDVDERKALRLDGSYAFTGAGRHLLKFGYDGENNTARTHLTNSGGVVYLLDAYTDGGVLPNGAVAPAGTTAVANRMVYTVDGAFRVVTEALYAEDNWKLLNDRLLLRLGVRREGYTNRNGSGGVFVKSDRQWAPRLAAAYDLRGDGTAKVVAAWGRYFLQIPAIFNIRMAGGETFYSDYFVLDGIGAKGVPILGPQLGNRTIISPGIPKDPASQVDRHLAPLYQDEFMVGYETALGRRWRGSVKAVHKDLRSLVEDVGVDAALQRYAAARGYGNFVSSGFDYYVLTNPGRDLNFALNLTQDLNGDGVVDRLDQSGGPGTKMDVHIPAAELGFPAAERKYYAAILELEHPLANKWFGSFSYTWMHSYGSSEGVVDSILGLDDGPTNAFDLPGLTENSRGDLPNDHRHTFRARGGYQVSKGLLVTAALLHQSGRPISGLGIHPTDPAAAAYGTVAYFVQGNPSPRGSWGRTPWMTQLDLGARFKPAWGRDKLTLGVDIFNVLNGQAVTAVSETAETITGDYPAPHFRRPRDFQAPRSVRLSATYDF